jgi:hypothetical protein
VDVQERVIQGGSEGGLTGFRGGKSGHTAGSCWLSNVSGTATDLQFYAGLAGRLQKITLTVTSF